MTEKRLLKWLNPLLGLLLVAQCLSLILIGLWPEALLLHRFCGALLLMLALVHIYLNRAWIQNAFFARKKG